MNAPSTTRPGEATDTAVVFRCDSHLLAVFTRHVERLLLSEEVQEEPRSAGQPVTRAWIDGHPWAVWDLGLLLGSSEESASHVLLRVPGATASQAGAATGPCLPSSGCRRRGRCAPGCSGSRRRFSRPRSGRPRDPDRRA
jgi:hypothetical protein